jgi:oligopeptide/dipeptide ABC transporter ATP-binding protein
MTASAVEFDGRDIFGLSEPEMRRLRGNEIAVVFQNPMSALNPYLSIERQLTEAMQAHAGLARKEARARAIALLARVAIPEPERRIWWYPHQFSGGMLQRAMLAMALSCGPKLLIADEPTTALDATVQAEVLDLLADLRKRGSASAAAEGTAHQLAMLFVSHDIDIVGRMCERVLVMYGGRIVEEGPAREIMSSPIHPYTRALLECVPRLTSPRPDGPLPTIPGAPPNAVNLPSGCAFHPRCAAASAKCRETVPQPVAATPARRVACLFLTDEK